LQQRKKVTEKLTLMNMQGQVLQEFILPIHSFPETPAEINAASNTSLAPGLAHSFPKAVGRK
jgi:hypothetical protein